VDDLVEKTGKSCFLCGWNLVFLWRKWGEQIYFLPAFAFDLHKYRKMLVGKK